MHELRSACDVHVACTGSLDLWISLEIGLFRILDLSKQMRLHHHALESAWRVMLPGVTCICHTISNSVLMYSILYNDSVLCTNVGFVVGRALEERRVSQQCRSSALCKSVGLKP